VVSYAQQQTGKPLDLFVQTVVSHVVLGHTFPPFAQVRAQRQANVSLVPQGGVLAVTIGGSAGQRQMEHAPSVKPAQQVSIIMDVQATQMGFAKPVQHAGRGIQQ
jgi:hypothetical protein